MRIQPLWRLSLFACLLALASLPVLPTRTGAETILNDSAVLKPFEHHVWNEVLNRFVDNDSQVQWLYLRASPERLNQYLSQLQRVSPDSHPTFFPTWQHRLAYWINAHNALMLRIGLNHYPPAQLTAGNGPEQATGKTDWLLLPDWLKEPRYTLGNEPYSIFKLQEKLLKEFYFAPEAYLALTTLTVGSPPLRKPGYSAKTLETDLKQQAERFLQSANAVAVDGGCQQLRLSAHIMRFAPGIVQYLQAEKYRQQPQVQQWLRPYLPAAQQQVLLTQPGCLTRQAVGLPMNWQWIPVWMPVETTLPDG
ncbi:MAG: DUF547 domain-containing protein [Candidatus Melainabacteria bacterium]|nr:DUF547 domain-containing protein [Candidatus Melainabacteria bacterium]